MIERDPSRESAGRQRVDRELAEHVDRLGAVVGRVGEDVCEDLGAAHGLALPIAEVDEDGRAIEPLDGIGPAVVRGVGDLAELMNGEGPLIAQPWRGLAVVVDVEPMRRRADGVGERVAEGADTHLEGPIELRFGQRRGASEDFQIGPACVLDEEKIRVRARGVGAGVCVHARSLRRCEPVQVQRVLLSGVPPASRAPRDEDLSVPDAADPHPAGKSSLRRGNSLENSRKQKPCGLGMRQCDVQLLRPDEAYPVQAKPHLTEPMDDETFVRAIARGETRALGDLAELHESMLLGIALALVGHRRDVACDVVQDAWVSVLRSASTFRATGSVRAWLTRITVNAARDRLRRERSNGGLRSFRLTNDAAANEQVNVADALGPTESLDGALRLLSAREREVVLLCHCKGLTHVEAAHALDMPIGSLKTTLTRAMRTLRAQLGEEAGS